MDSRSSNGRRHAVVIGGSMAGLLAARVLSDHFPQVTVLERDSFPVARENRRGVPQGRHTHGLLAGGRQTLETLFPGISQDVVRAGAVTGDIVGESRWFMEGACHARFASGLQGFLMSRPFLEGEVRDRVRRLAGVRFRENCDVEGLAASADNSRVLGVRIAGETVEADLVVDTAGRGSHSPEWLDGMGYTKAAEERVEVGLSYTTRWFRRLPTDLNGDRAIIIPPTPSGKRGGVMIAQEGGRWSVTLIAHFVPAAPSEMEGFVEFAKNLPAPYIYEVVGRAEPLGDAAGARFPASMRRRYEKLKRFPEGYLVMGDAMSSFNPIYGQGMTVAALESMELQAALGEGTESLAKRFFARASKVVDIPWSMAVGNDLRMPETKGPRTLGVKVINAYLGKLHKAAHHDPAVVMAFHRVANLLASPASILHPRIAMRVLWGNLRSRPRVVEAPHAMRANAAQ
ncbi:MAG TPA: hypothetical protein VKU19_38685 [Bryobacteraceae bacterium]|nr:hypothetical protein [Bryobacteraceae bacterium]